MGARKCSGGARDGSPDLHKGETWISPPPKSKLLQARAVFIFASSAKGGRAGSALLHAIKERFYYTRLPPRSQEAAGEEAAAPFWQRLV